ncbi:chromosome transmission fidelity protein 18 homolog [Leguminivora glycinivorella]|uniref:chromosome transmission fidelity protein 18 homolog n=1 Tax=Leguminivora glycinivorella TaxID=1035111 RepID=UPI00200E9F24|nr:chromosome transmission fidelity protein 18 homolog [Leguminivora glycinivorella]
MSDYPDPDEEYELMYADELEMLRDDEDSTDHNIVKKNPLPAKRSLDFSSPTVRKHLPTFGSQNSVTENIDGINSLPLSQPTQPTAVVSSNKRTVDDLFGDIGDIEDDILLPSKKQKTEDEEDEELIQKILEGRRLRQLLLEPSNRVQGDAKPNFNVKDNISLDIPRWAFMPVTNSDGDRFYVRLESEDSWEQSLDMTKESVSLHANYASTWAEARKLLEEKQKQKEVQPEELQVVEKDENDNLMWVDKFKPQSYVDLLSEEPVNRALLHWLHLWDKIVFKKEVKTKEPQQRITFSKRAGEFQLTNKWKGKKEAEPEMDEDGRPHHKVALLCGPPGVGKTTLAHLLAKLAGYRPVELNASDERSTEAFRTALHNATLMRSVLDPDRRPNCLILDEIDGAPLPTVELLVKWCTATAAAAGKKKAKTQPLRRPVIAICNNLYATSLRPLRPVSLILQVSTVSLPRLSARLSLAAARAGSGVAPRVAAAVAARAHPDVRAALHLLSFLDKLKGGAQVTVADVEKASIGTKDCHKSLMQGLQAIFTVNDKDTDILKTVQAAGEYDRLADGIFENYLQARVDSRLLIACETLSWLRFYDTIYSWTLRTQNYSLYGALPLCIARCHTLLASRTPQRVKFPTQAQEMYRRQTELDATMSSVARGCAASVALSRTSLRLSLIPLLPYLLSPVLRTANVQLCTENERKALRACAGAMCDYGLQYVQQRTPEGLYAFVLEPDIHKIAFFGNEDRARPPPPVRQAIAREQQLEVIRRNEEMANRVSGAQKSTEGASKAAPAMKEPLPKKDVPLPNHLQRLKPKEVTKAAPQVHKDFFGRIVPLSQVQRSDTVPDVISSSSVFYQYREGFNNAVRRNVRTKDLL